MTNYYFCLCSVKQKVKCESLIPFVQINYLNDSMNKVDIILKNANKIEMEFVDKE